MTVVPIRTMIVLVVAYDVAEKCLRVRVFRAFVLRTVDRSQMYVITSALQIIVIFFSGENQRAPRHYCDLGFRANGRRRDAQHYNNMSIRSIFFAIYLTSVNYIFTFENIHRYLFRGFFFFFYFRLLCITRIGNQNSFIFKFTYKKKKTALFHYSPLP